MAEREDGHPALRLVIEKGPSEGRIYDFIPRSGFEIKIGRVVRGNNLAIKDEGISSKHALIRFDSQSGGPDGFWAISDLGSSNGTFLNKRELDPFTPVAISDGDVIKIGELTSIVVKLEDVRVEVEKGNVGRNPRRKCRNLEVTDSTNELRLGKDNESKGNVRGRNRKGKAALGENEVAQVKGINEVELVRSKRVTRSAATKENGVEIENLGRRTPPRRNGRKKEGNEVGGKEKEIKRSMKRDHHNLEILTGNKLQNSGEVEMALPIEEKGGENLSSKRATKNLSKDPDIESLGENEEPKSKRRKGTRGRNNSGMKTLTEKEDTGEVGTEVLEEIREECGTADGLAEENDGIEVDLEKITLGEWFDFLDVHLPKQIIDVTEGMILDMKQKAARFHDFLLQQKNSDSKVELPVV